MAHGISKKERVYILKCDQELPEAQQSKFHIRPLTSDQRASVKDKSFVTEVQKLGPKNEGVGVARMHSGTVELEYVRHALVKVENFFDGDGDKADFDIDSKPALKEAVIRLLSAEMVSELAEEIQKVSELTKQDEKNS